MRIVWGACFFANAVLVAADLSQHMWGWAAFSTLMALICYWQIPPRG